MSKSLIRKNQLHPDISDLVSGYGTGFFVTPVQLNDAIDSSQVEIAQGAVLVSGNQTISGRKIFATGIVAPNLVYNTGDQTISGVKTFASYPTVNGIRVLLSGEIASSIISMTYSGLTTLKAATGLIPGQLYRISDFHLKWHNQSINDTGVKSGLAPEPLIVLALSGNKISQEAKSELYPQDTVYYDIDSSRSFSWGPINNSTAIPDSKGWIYRRIDHNLNINIPWDWRHITVNCCRPIVTGIPTWTGTTNYNRFSVVRGISSNTTGKLYYSIVDSNSGQSLTSINSWLPVSDFVEGNTYFSTTESFGFQARNKNGIFVNLPADTGTRIQQPTFTSSLTGQGTSSLINCYNIKIEKGYSNVIRGSSFHSNTIGNLFISNTISSYFNSNTLGNYFQNNIIGTNFNGNTTRSTFSNNVISANFGSNTIGRGFYNNTIAGSLLYNTFGNYIQSNAFGINFNSNTLGNNFYSNAIGNNFNTNAIGNNFNNNIIGDTYFANAIGNNFNFNTIKNTFFSNVIGNNFYSNIIEDNFYYNVIGNIFRESVIGLQFYFNTIGNEFNNNTIGNGFFANSIGNYFTENTIGDNFRLNTSEGDLTIGNVTGATHVYNPYNTRLFQNSNLTVRLSYFNSSDQLVVTDPTA